MSLCKASKEKILLYDRIYTHLATASSSSDLVGAPLPWQSHATSLVNLIRNPNIPNFTPIHPTCRNSVAYIHHSSGTSTSVPKPMPQTHHSGLVVLPRLQGQKIATFTVTPLYYGGIADCLRAWTSEACIWLIPGSVPITSWNILKSFEVV
jgi:hypothetical protein